MTHKLAMKRVREREDAKRRKEISSIVNHTVLPSRHFETQVGKSVTHVERYELETWGEGKIREYVSSRMCGELGYLLAQTPGMVKVEEVASKDGSVNYIATIEVVCNG